MRRWWVVPILLVGASALSTAVAGAQDSEIIWESHIVYDMTVADDHIVMTTEMWFTANKPSARSGCCRITRYFFDSVWMVVPKGVEDLVAVSRSQELDVTYEDFEDPDPEYHLAVIELPRNLFYKQKDKVTVTYTIPGSEPRSDAFERINAAYKAFFAYAWGDPNLTTVEVRVPIAYEVEVTGGEYSTRFEDGIRILEADLDGDPFDWSIWVTARDDNQLEESTVEVPDATVTVRSWPGDDMWRDDVVMTVTEGLPVLQDLIGIEWNASDQLEIIQSVDPNLVGYGGWFETGNDRIVIGEWVDPQLVLHELSHAWFDDSLFGERWITEGLAEEFAAHAVESMDLQPGAIDREYPFRASVEGRDAFPLNEWEAPDFFDDSDEDREYYGYNASWWVIRRLVDEIGIEAMADVLAAADANLISYRSTDPVESVAEDDNWQRLLDLSQELAGATEFESILAEYVLTDEQSELLVDRSTARDDYTDLIEVSDGWQVPYLVRVAMEEWRFEDAMSLMADAVEVMDVRDEIEAYEDAQGFSIEDSARVIYEDDEDFETSIAHMEDQRDAMEVIVAAGELAAAERGFLVTLGLYDEKDPEAEYDEARALLESNDMDGARLAAQDVQAALDAAEPRGRWRWNLALGAATAAWIVGSLLLTGIFKLVRFTYRRIRRPKTA